MAAVTAQVAFDNARTLLNDDAGVTFTNAVLLPKLVEAFRELLVNLRLNASSIMIEQTNANLAIGIVTYPAISNIIEPIMLWEKAQAGADSTYIKMTEFDPLPNRAQTTTLKYWDWNGIDIKFVGSTVTRTVKVQYWGELTEPTSSSSSLLFIDAQYYLGPRTAAIMAGSLGEAEMMDALTALANKSLDGITQANRGRVAPPGSTRP